MNDKKIIICDIDGTIANVQHRLHFIKNPDGTMKPYAERDWDSFNAACVDDEPYEDVIEVLHSLILNCCSYNVCGVVEREVHFFSGRNASVRRQTVQWLAKHVCHTQDWATFPSMLWLDHLHMRSENDFRPDTQVKFEMMYELKIMPEDVLCILDDRQSVVDMWRENGFRVMQVDAWKEEERVRELEQEVIDAHLDEEFKGYFGHTIPMLDTPDFDLGDIQEDDPCSDK